MNSARPRPSRAGYDRQHADRFRIELVGFEPTVPGHNPSGISPFACFQTFSVHLSAITQRSPFGRSIKAFIKRSQVGNRTPSNHREVNPHHQHHAIPNTKRFRRSITPARIAAPSSSYQVYSPNRRTSNKLTVPELNRMPCGTRRGVTLSIPCGSPTAKKQRQVAGDGGRFGVQCWPSLITSMRLLP